MWGRRLTLPFLRFDVLAEPAATQGMGSNMTITSSTLTRSAGVAAAAAGLLFIGVQIKHPHLDAVSITTTEVIVRNSLKALMAVLGLAGITGMYLRQVKQTGVLGLLGYLLLSLAYLLIMNTVFVAGYILPSLADTDPGYVNDVLTAANGGSPDGDIGLLKIAILVQGVVYLAGGLAFGIALFRARVLARWAAALLAVGGLVSAVLSIMPDALYRLLAFPNGIAMIGLGVSLWLDQRRRADPATATATSEPTPQAAVR